MATQYKVRNVEAMQLEGNDGNGKGNNAGEVKEWSGGRESWTPGANGQLQPQIVVETRQGTRVANVGDYVVKRGTELFVVRAKEFEAKYENA